MGSMVKRGDEVFDNLSLKEALTKAQELVADGRGDVFLFDSFGDPMGLVELERAVESARFGDNL